MPDYLTGLACVAMIVLLCFWQDYDRLEFVLLAGAICFAAVSHSSNLPILLGLAAVGLIGRGGGVLSGKAAIIGLGAVILGLAGDVLFVTAVERVTGLTPIRPPFLTARLVADGPGYKFLASHASRCASRCADIRLEPPNDSDLFLWSKSYGGVFLIADFNSQYRMSNEDAAFAIATLREYPLMTLTSSTKALARQISF